MHIVQFAAGCVYVSDCWNRRLLRQSLVELPKAKGENKERRGRTHTRKLRHRDSNPGRSGESRVSCSARLCCMLMRVPAAMDECVDGGSRRFAVAIPGCMRRQEAVTHSRSQCKRIAHHRGLHPGREHVCDVHALDE